MFRLEKKIRERNINCSDISSDDTPSDFEKGQIHDFLNIYMTLEFEKKIIAQSPYTKYFENHFEKLKLSEQLKDSSNQTTKNKYFLPKSMIILRGYLYLMPLWAGLMTVSTKRIYPQNLSNILTRVVNNCVENSFKYKKHCLLGNVLKCHMPSSLINLFWRDIQAKFIAIYKKIYETEYKFTLEKNEKEPEEMWRGGGNPHKKYKYKNFTKNMIRIKSGKYLKILNFN